MQIILKYNDSEAAATVQPFFLLNYAQYFLRTTGRSDGADSDRTPTKIDAADRKSAAGVSEMPAEETLDSLPELSAQVEHAYAVDGKVVVAEVAVVDEQGARHGKP